MQIRPCLQNITPHVHCKTDIIDKKIFQRSEQYEKILPLDD